MVNLLQKVATIVFTKQTSKIRNPGFSLETTRHRSLLAASLGIGIGVLLLYLSLNVHVDAAEVVEPDLSDGDGPAIEQASPELELVVRVVPGGVVGMAPECKPDVRLGGLPLPLRGLETRHIIISQIENFVLDI